MRREQWELVAWSTVAVSITVVGLAIAVLASDASVSAWSPAGQNLETLGGRTSCGLADQLGDGLPRALADSSDVPVLIDPPLFPFFPCARRPELRDGLIEIPRYVLLLPDRWLVEEKAAPFAAVRNLYTLRTVVRGPRELVVVAVDETVPEFSRSDPLRS